MRTPYCDFNVNKHIKNVNNVISQSDECRNANERAYVNVKWHPHINIAV